MLCAYCNSQIIYRTENCPHCGAHIPPNVQETLLVAPPNPAVSAPAYPPQQQGAAFQPPPAGQYPQQFQPGDQPYQAPQPYTPSQQQARNTPIVLGIVGIILTFIFPIAGIICGAEGINIFQTDKKRGLNPPSNYIVFCIIALVLNGLRFLFTILSTMLRAR